MEFSDRYLGIPNNINVFESCFMSGQLVQRRLNSDGSENEKTKMQRKYKITNEGVHSWPNINRKISKCDPNFAVGSLEM